MMNESTPLRKHLSGDLVPRAEVDRDQKSAGSTWQSIDRSNSMDSTAATTFEADDRASASNTSTSMEVE
jgi:hypothetical protein